MMHEVTTKHEITEMDPELNSISALDLTFIWIQPGKTPMIYSVKKHFQRGFQNLLNKVDIDVDVHLLCLHIWFLSSP